jgi:SAM-dependent methyltransferase
MDLTSTAVRGDMLATFESRPLRAICNRAHHNVRGLVLWSKMLATVQNCPSRNWKITPREMSAMREKTETPRSSAVYDEKFYEYLVARSLDSARQYLSYLWNSLQPKSVLDVGCGHGAWLKACHELGATQLLGLDGNWNSQSSMIDSAIEFRSIDLNKPFSIPEKVDLTICLEVAEHLEPRIATQFIHCLTETSDVVLFSAAYLNQGGTNHINEQQHSYWAKLFAARHFYAFDLFRPVFWGNENVDFWYRQNVFLYVRKDSSEWQVMANSGHRSMANIDFMNCIHPDMLIFGSRPSALTFRGHLVALFPSFIRAMRRRLLQVNKQEG